VKIFLEDDVYESFIKVFYSIPQCKLTRKVSPNEVFTLFFQSQKNRIVYQIWKCIL